MKYILSLTLCFFVFNVLQAETFIVNSQTTFDSALSNSVPGDSIIWEEGLYFNIELEVDEDGLYIGARTLGETVFTGFSYGELNGDDLVFEGFQFLDGDIGTNDIMNIRGSNILFTEVNMRAYTCYKYLRIREQSQYVTVLRCNFENRINQDDQNILSILVDNDQPGYHKIQYCSFKNFDGFGNDQGIEPIRIGVSSQADFISRSLVEYCYFTRCNGDGEIISSKARQNVYRHNTFENNPLSELVLRHGSENIVYGNFFIKGKGGVRVREGQNHYIYNNYFFHLTDRSIFLQNDPSDPLDDINIAFNQMVDCNVVRLGGSGDNPPTNVTLANNILSNSIDNLFREATNNETWVGNMTQGNLGITTPSSGVTEADLDLVENGLGYFGISENSPAIDAAMEGFKPIPQYEGMDPVDSNIDFDIMMEARPENIALKDLGCSEYPHDTIIQPFITEDNTGTSYNSTTSAVSTKQIKRAEIDNLTIYPNPTSEELNIELTLKSKVDIAINILMIDGKLAKNIYTEQDVMGELLVSEKVTGLHQGVYILQVQGLSDGRIVLESNKRIIIQ